MYWFLAIGTLVKQPLCSAANNWELRASAQSINMYGDNGYPCLNPLWGLKLVQDLWFSKTKKKEKVI